MIKCEILETFNGSQDGRFTETFEAGTVRHLTQTLFDIAEPEGWVKSLEIKSDEVNVAEKTPEKKAVTEAVIQNKAVTTEAKTSKKKAPATK